MAGLIPLLPSCSDQAARDLESDESVSTTAALAASCSGCHAGPDAAIASFSGRSQSELAALMLEYQRGEGTTVMHRLARTYSDEQITAIAGYLAEAPAP
ncbi:MAG: cytochrome C [Pseudomonadota bacterium]